MKAKQPNSKMCFICGLENPVGLKLKIYETEPGVKGHNDETSAGSLVGETLAFICKNWLKPTYCTGPPVFTAERLPSAEQTALLAPPARKEGAFPTN